MLDLVAIETPHYGDLSRNMAYARRCVADSLHRGESPFSWLVHSVQPGITMDRKNAREAGADWAKFADKVAVYMDYGLSPEMDFNIKLALARNIPIEHRYINV